MIALDTNLLVYAHREDSVWHDAAYTRVTELAEGRAPWAIPWPCIHEFLAIVTHPKIFTPPTPLDAALDQVEAWLQSPSLLLLSESEGYWSELRSSLRVGRIVGPQFMTRALQLSAVFMALKNYGPRIEISAGCRD